MYWVGKERWLELSLSVNGELAEAVADVISRYIKSGVVIENDVKYKGDQVTPMPDGLARVYGYIPVDSKLYETKQLIEEALWHLSQIEQIPQLNYRTIENENWMEAWKENYHPILVGKRMLILPAWIENHDKVRIPIKINPGMAFGTGTHPTTQLCIEALEEYVDQGQCIIDVGCGSGILSIAAVLLGSESVLAVDIENESIVLTRQNAALNGVKDKITVGLGSVKQVIEGQYEINCAPIVVANILAPIILKLFNDGLAALVEDNGFLILSGILSNQKEEILARARKEGLLDIKSMAMGDWLAMVFKKQK